ncbi:hypothetical protein GNE08_26835 (plasmid) [Trichormus variabilis ARAD]|uniref:Uncharacterized protein n=1 Tax=Trichormus variabilis N2B TaxID=2681315 RepID=A0ABR6SH55_ANAVA|nr:MULTISPECIES: hypothetical protein [Nostocaceae]MBC1259032.1 hypothetical protein [Trichormus variabilis V5]MBC1217816.1 hypothetical protein [Trichormus variabilis ARAD]MBC1305604.1 hypothetical protein [Trichormus variabilis N2B]MBC1314512.1 hypothetical protein [Trichormus variabilis PNB]MBC1329884.1 hypothetical protein [Trichormus variabilis 9RC]
MNTYYSSSNNTHPGEIFAHIEAQIRRLDWMQENIKNYLMQTFNKRARVFLTVDEGEKFLDYL